MKRTYFSLEVAAKERFTRPLKTACTNVGLKHTDTLAAYAAAKTLSERSDVLRVTLTLVTEDRLGIYVDGKISAPK